MRPEGQCSGHGQCNNAEVLNYGSAGPPGGPPRELEKNFLGQRLAEVVLELFAFQCTPPISTYFTSRYSSMPYFEPSRPRPELFTPPKGATSVEMMPAFTPTIPTSMRSATRHTRPRSRL